MENTQNRLIDILKEPTLKFSKENDNDRKSLLKMWKNHVKRNIKLLFFLL